MTFRFISLNNLIRVVLLMYFTSIFIFVLFFYFISFYFILDLFASQDVHAVAACVLSSVLDDINAAALLVTDINTQNENEKQMKNGNNNFHSVVFFFFL